jgi:hypothetical protein
MSLQALVTRATDTIEGARCLHRPADRLNEPAASVMPHARRGWLAGTWLGHPVHPFLVSVPIGCWTSASLLDALGQRRAARTLIGAGVLPSSRPPSPACRTGWTPAGQSGGSASST